MKNYLHCNGYDLNIKLIEDYSKERLSRIIYDFELRNYSFEEKKIIQNDLDAKTLLMEIITNIKENSFDNENVFYKFNVDFHKKLIMLVIVLLMILLHLFLHYYLLNLKYKQIIVL